MQRLWAPWRKVYIRPDSKTKKNTCLFCALRLSKNDASNYILKRTRHNYAILNLYPYNNGHVLIVPNRHVSSVETLNSEEKLDWLKLYEEVQAAILKTVNPHGFNVGLNLGRAAGAGIPDHLHLHIVPRWSGDSNFMPVVARTKVISESLDSCYRLLKKAMGAGKGKKK